MPTNIGIRTPSPQPPMFSTGAPQTAVSAPSLATPIAGGTDTNQLLQLMSLIQRLQPKEQRQQGAGGLGSLLAGKGQSPTGPPTIGGMS